MSKEEELDYTMSEVVYPGSLKKFKDMLDSGKVSKAKKLILNSMKVLNYRYGPIPLAEYRNSIEQWHLEKIPAIFPDLEKLDLSCQDFPQKGLSNIGKLKNLKVLSLYWSLLDYGIVGEEADKFLSSIPNTIEELDLSRTAVFLGKNSPKLLGELIERSPNLTILNIAETSISSFPKLSKEYQNLKELKLFHHTHLDRNQKLTGEDLLNIALNFPNLIHLNIIGCDAINYQDDKTLDAITKFSEKDDFDFCANEDLQTIFEQLVSCRYLKEHHGFSQQQIKNLIQLDNKIVDTLLSRGVRLFIQEFKIKADDIFHIYDKSPEKFNALLKSSKLIRSYGATIDKILSLFDESPEKLKALQEFDVHKLMEKSGLGIDEMSKLYDLKPTKLKEMASFSYMYYKSHEDLRQEILRIIKPGVIMSEVVIEQVNNNNISKSFSGL